MRVLMLLCVLVLVGCAGTREKPYGSTFAGGESNGCSWYLADGKERTGLDITGTVCGGRLRVKTDESRAFEGQAQALAAQQAIVDGVRKAVADGLRVGLGIAAPLLAQRGVKLPDVAELVPEPEPTEVEPPAKDEPEQEPVERVPLSMFSAPEPDWHGPAQDAAWRATLRRVGVAD